MGIFTSVKNQNKKKQGSLLFSDVLVKRELERNILNTVKQRGTNVEKLQTFEAWSNTLCRKINNFTRKEISGN